MKTKSDIGLVGLAVMGENLVLNIESKGFTVTAYNRSYNKVEKFLKGRAQGKNIRGVDNIESLVSSLEKPRKVMLMVKAGQVVDDYIEQLIPHLEKGDIIIDGGNSNFKHSVKMGSMLEEYDIGFMDCGTSGGVWGLNEGYCLMVGASLEVAKAVEPILKALSPTPQTGWLHVGPVGSGHFTKMIHNGIEYGMMESFAEGLELLKGREEYAIDVAEVTELWRHGSVVRSWLLDLTAEALKGDQDLEKIEPFVADSGEGRWTAVEAIEQGIPAPVLTQALQVRFRSQEKSKGYGYKILSIMRNAFGGHVMKKKG